MNKKSLERPLHGIAISALQENSLSKFSIKEQMSWAKTCQTEREEDKAYFLQAEILHAEIS